MSLFKLFRPYPELKTVLVNLKSGSVFRGVVFQVKGRFIILKNSELLSDRGQKVSSIKPLDGELLVLLVDVDFVQVL